MIQTRLDFDSPPSRETTPVRVQPGTTPLGERGAPLRPCENCGELFEPKRQSGRDPQRFCSEHCRVEAWRAKHADETPEQRRERHQKEAEAERNRKKALAAARCRRDTAIARWAALMALAERYQGDKAPGICVSHVRQWLADPHKKRGRGIELAWELNWPGSMFSASPWFEPTGNRVTTFHKSANARKVQEYRLSDEGRRVLRVFTCTMHGEERA